MSAFLVLVAILAAQHIETGEACTDKMDLLFIMDGSETICDGPASCSKWESNLQLAKDIVGRLSITPSETKVAVVTFSNEVYAEWNLNAYREKGALVSAIGSILYPGGEFNNPPSSEKINTEIFSKFNGDRPNVLNLGVVITDGVPGITTEQAVNQSTSIQQNSVAMFVVCSAPGCNEDWAKAVASPPTKPGLKTYFLVNDYSELGSIKEELYQNICYYIDED